MLGLTVYTAAFVCETVRSGVNTVPLGQAEAARSLGLTFGQNLRIVLLPQAFRAVIIPLGSVLIALTKNTTIASAIGVAEAALLMKEMIENTSALLVVGGIFAIGFVILTLPTGLLFGWLGKRLAVRGEGWHALRPLRRTRSPRPGPQPDDHRPDGGALRRGVRLGDLEVAAADQFTAAKWEPFLTGDLWITYVLPGIKGTLTAAAASIVLALVLGCLLGVGRLSPISAVRWACSAFVEFFRAVPVLIMMIFAYSCTRSTTCSRRNTWRWPVSSPV